MNKMENDFYYDTLIIYKAIHIYYLSLEALEIGYLDPHLKDGETSDG